MNIKQRLASIAGALALTAAATGVVGPTATPAIADDNSCTIGDQVLGDAGNYYAGGTYVGQVVLEWSQSCHAERARFQFSYYYHGDRSGSVDLYVGPADESYESQIWLAAGSPDANGDLYTKWVAYSPVGTYLGMTAGFHHACDPSTVTAYSSRHDFQTGATLDGPTYAYGNAC